MIRPARAAFAAAAVALGVQVPGASPASAADAAATVNGVEITVEQFEDVVTSLAATPGFEQFAPSPGSRTLAGDGARSLLGVLVSNELQRQFLGTFDVPAPTADDVAAWQAGIDPAQPVAQLDGAALEVVGENALLTAALDELAIGDDEAALRERYQRSPASLGVYCVTAVVVADPGVADDVAAAIGDGGDVQAVAAANDATPSDWSCSPLTSVGDDELLADLLTAGPGDVVGPVRVPDGVAVLVVDDVDTAADKLDAFYQRLQTGEGATSPGFLAYQGSALQADVEVDPRYGRWDATTATIVPLGA